MEQIDLQKAYIDFEQELMKHLKVEGISRSDYTKVLEKIQKKYGLKQGHPQFLEWVFTCVGRSPIIVEDEDEGAGKDGK